MLVTTFDFHKWSDFTLDIFRAKSLQIVRKNYDS